MGFDNGIYVPLVAFFTILITGFGVAMVGFQSVLLFPFY